MCPTAFRCRELDGRIIGHRLHDDAQGFGWPMRGSAGSGSIASRTSVMKCVLYLAVHEQVVRGGKNNFDLLHLYLLY